MSKPLTDEGARVFNTFSRERYYAGSLTGCRHNVIPCRAGEILPALVGIFSS